MVSKLRLQVNEEKTKYRVVTRQPRPRIRQNKSLNEDNFGIIREFEYLGAVITDDNRIEKVSGRMLVVNKALYSLSTLLSS